MVDALKIQDIKKEHLLALAELYEKGIPNAVFCALGRRFLATFFGFLSAREDVCSLAGVNEAGEVKGAIVGTLHRSRSYRAVLKKHAASLAVAAGWRCVSPRLLLWLIRSAIDKLRPRANQPDLPEAELLVISIHPSAQGTGLAQRLVEDMERRFRQMGFSGEYTILTEANNERANRFYQRMGATLVAQTPHRGLLINGYRKAVAAAESRKNERRSDPGL